MSKPKRVRMGPKLRATVVAIRHARVAIGHTAVGHTLVIGTSAAGKMGYDLLRMSEHERRHLRKTRAEGERDAGDEAWA